MVSNSIDAEHEPALESPCVGICVIEPRSGYCEGCLRTLAEIASWSTCSPAERERTMSSLDRRALG